MLEATLSKTLLEPTELAPVPVLLCDWTVAGGPLSDGSSGSDLYTARVFPSLLHCPLEEALAPGNMGNQIHNQTNDHVGNQSLLSSGLRAYIIICNNTQDKHAIMFGQIPALIWHRLA